MKREVRYKRLEAPFFTSPILGEDNEQFLQRMQEDGYTKIVPLFNRDGWYYDRWLKLTWYEKDGYAWKHKDLNSDTELFLYTLDQLNTKCLNCEEINAIKTLMIYGICPKELKDLLFRHSYNMQIIQSQRDVRLHRLRFNKRYININQNQS